MMHRNRILLNRFIKGRIVGFPLPRRVGIPVTGNLFWQELSASFRALPAAKKKIYVPSG